MAGNHRDTCRAQVTMLEPYSAPSFDASRCERQSLPQFKRDVGGTITAQRSQCTTAELITASQII
jgi:hypothetical protein